MKINNQETSISKNSEEIISAKKILSDKPLSEYRTSITTFRGFTGTRPDQEFTNITWGKTKDLVCPNKPAVLTDKKQGLYFVPCELKEAPLIGKTLASAKENGASLIGKMRSKSHVTKSNLLVMDIDGLEKGELKKIRRRMKADGITSVIYTTHSYGRSEKPGGRYRLVMPLDREVLVEEYRKAWHGFDAHYFDGQIGKADSSGANLYQQQGVWCCHPDRQDKAKSQTNEAGLINADFLIDVGRKITDENLEKEANKPLEISVQSEPALKKPETFSSGNQRGDVYPIADANKVAESCNQIKKLRDTKGEGQSEPLWRDCLGIVGHCENGEKLCHEWSSGHPGYDRHETERKIECRIKVPPTTCAQFRKTNPDGCLGCTQNCHSPITLGWKKEAPLAPLTALAVMQQQFCLLKTGGKVWIVDGTSLTERTAEGFAKNLELYDVKNGKLLIKRALAEQYPNAKADEIISELMISPETVCYDGVEFNPKGSSGNHLNLWVEPTIKPTKGQWKRIKKFLYNVVCNKNKGACRYLLDYLAHALQHPEEKPGVMIILLGGQGTGKGTFGRIVQKIWSATFLQTNNIDTVTGTFNAALERTFFVFLDEALFAGNRKASDALKSLVTETSLQINEKYQPSRQIKSYHRFIAATNAEHFKNTEHDDRRDFTLRVSEEYKGDYDYWNTLNREIENGGVEAMVYDLLTRDLSDFNVRDKPDTKELLEQKLESLSPFQRWWHACLEQGCMKGDGRWPGFISTTEIIDNVVEFSGGRMHRKLSPRSVKKELAKVCPGADQEQRQEQHFRTRGYTLPTLELARIEFEAYVGSSMQWPDRGLPEYVETYDDVAVEDANAF